VVNGFEALSHGDLSLTIKAGVQYGLWGGAIEGLGTDERIARWMPDIVAASTRDFPAEWLDSAMQGAGPTAGGRSGQAIGVPGTRHAGTNAPPTPTACPRANRASPSGSSPSRAVKSSSPAGFGALTIVSSQPVTPHSRLAELFRCRLPWDFAALPFGRRYRHPPIGGWLRARNPPVRGCRGCHVAATLET
jgi:hypothetical protein